MSIEPIVHLVEDDAGMRDALCMLLRADGLDVRSYPTAEDFLGSVALSQPICLLTDIRLPGMDGIALARHLAERDSDSAVVMITGHGQIRMAVNALKSGVVDFVEKPFDPALLLESVRTAVRCVTANRERKAAAADIERRVAALSARELQILGFMMDGHLNKTIAAQFGVSPRTLEHQRARIMEKMRARSMSELIKLVLSARGIQLRSTIASVARLPAGTTAERDDG